MKIAVEIRFTDESDGSERTINGIGEAAKVFERNIAKALREYEAHSLPGTLPWEGMDIAVVATEFNAVNS